jgi:hypothetical protein
VQNTVADQFYQNIGARRFIRQWKSFVAEQKELKWRQYRRQRLWNAAQVQTIYLGNFGRIQT